MSRYPHWLTSQTVFFIFFLFFFTDYTYDVYIEIAFVIMV